MITRYMGTPVGPAIGVLFTLSELKAMDAPELRKGCYLKDGQYYSMIKWKGNLIALGVFDSPEECNLTWDRERLKRRRTELLTRCKGFTLSTARTSLRVNVFIDGTAKYFKCFPLDEERQAKELYDKEFNKETKRQLAALN